MEVCVVDTGPAEGDAGHNIEDCYENCSDEAQKSSTDLAKNTTCKSPVETQEERKKEMICRLSETDAHFKHQMLGSPDLTREEKSQIAQDVLSHNHVTFLARFHKFLTNQDIQYFEGERSNYEINFYLNQISERLNLSKNKINVKNRRYEPMKSLLDKGEYFSDEQMKWRNPYLYEQMIGQYLTHEERQSEIDKSDLRFSTIILKHMSQQEENAVYYRQKEYADNQEEEEEDSDTDEEEEITPPCRKIPEGSGNLSGDDETENLISPEEKASLREEFLRIMQERFMSGQDTEFDYSTVDGNMDYDSLKLREQDEEEKYFDDDDGME